MKDNCLEPQLERLIINPPEALSDHTGCLAHDNPTAAQSSSHSPVLYQLLVFN